MARIDRERLDGAVFPVSATIHTRYDDIDSQNHVNNAAAAVILQEARVNLHYAAHRTDLSVDLRTVVAAVTIEYAGEMLHPSAIEIGTGILKIGRKSVTIAQRASIEGRPTLYAETTLVFTDDAGPVEIPAALRLAYEQFLIRTAG